MKQILIIAMLDTSLTQAAESKTSNKVYLDHEFKRLTQKQAIVTLATNPGAVVYVMTELELSDKGTLRVKRVSK